MLVMLFINSTLVADGHFWSIEQEGLFPSSGDFNLKTWSFLEATSEKRLAHASLFSDWIYYLTATFFAPSAFTEATASLFFLAASATASPFMCAAVASAHGYLADFCTQCERAGCQHRGCNDDAADIGHFCFSTRRFVIRKRCIPDGVNECGVYFLSSFTTCSQLLLFLTKSSSIDTVQALTKPVFS